MPENDIDPLPGSAALARRVERRRFLRWMASGAFYRVAIGSAVGLRFFLENPEAALATGGCCSYSCCGPSPCCGTSCCSKNCCYSGNPSECRNCSYDYGDYTQTACWSCFYSDHTTICCDCKASGCGSYNRCICEKAVHRPAAAALVGTRKETTLDGVLV
jgi:hypothetical protein